MGISLHEGLPFVEAYLRTGQMEKARLLSKDILAKDPRYQARLDQLWSKVKAEMP